jgi:hypothetical protein
MRGILRDPTFTENQIMTDKLQNIEHEKLVRTFTR